MQDSELQFSLEGQETNYYVNIYDHQDLTLVVQNLGSVKKLKFSVAVTSTSQIKINPDLINRKIKSGESKSFQISIMPEKKGVYDISITFLSQTQDKVIVPIQLTAIDCFSTLFCRASKAIYTLMGLSGSEFNEDPLSEYYSRPENFDIFIIELEHVLALLHLILDMHKKYNGLFTIQIMNYLYGLITKLTQLKTRIENKEKFYLDLEFERFFEMMPGAYSDIHPLKLLRDVL